jgi:AraC-like DNA-binding protein
MSFFTGWHTENKMRDFLERASAILRKLSAVTGADFVWRPTDTSLLRWLPLEQREHTCAYCRKVKRNPRGKLKECISAHREETIRKAMEIKGPFFMSCHAGVTEGVAPLFIGGRYQGAVFIGPYASGAVSPYPLIGEEYRQLPVFDREKAKRLRDLVALLIGALKPGKADQAEYHAQLLPEIKADDGRMFQAAAFMRLNFRGRLTAAQTAKCCALSVPRFLHLFRKQTGFSFSDYLQRLRVSEAGRLLETTNLSIGDIAAESGINSQSRLTVLFKRYHRKTPGEFRRDSRAGQNL